MDALESKELFYGKTHPGRYAGIKGGNVNFCGDDGYANMSAAKKTENYENVYRAQYPASDNEAAMTNTIAQLNNELKNWQNKKCSKLAKGSAKNVILGILSGGIANLSNRDCEKEKQQRSSALSTIINDYQSQLSSIKQTAKDKAAADAQAAKDKADAAAQAASAAQVTNAAAASNASCYAGTNLASMVPASSGKSSNSKLLLIGGAGLVTLLLVGVLLSRKGEAKP